MRFVRPLLLMAVTSAAAAAASLDRTTGDGVYTAAQAAEGDEIFQQVCMACHLPGWHETVGLYAKWKGKPLSALGNYLRLEMPQTDPGSLSPREYAAVTAYLLRLTGNPAGTTPLDDDADALADIRIDTLRSTR